VRAKWSTAPVLVTSSSLLAIEKGGKVKHADMFAWPATQPARREAPSRRVLIDGQLAWAAGTRGNTLGTSVSSLPSTRMRCWLRGIVCRRFSGRLPLLVRQAALSPRSPSATGAITYSIPANMSPVTRFGVAPPMRDARYAASVTRPLLLRLSSLMRCRCGAVNG
jgi:hypothetical protein